jgi:two-component system NtrC family response regulator
MEAYEWPGNVRELESKVKRAVIMADGNQIRPEDLELTESAMEPLPLNLKEVRDDAERKAIIRAMNHSNQNITDAAHALGVTRPTLYKLLERLGLKV